MCNWVPRRTPETLTIVPGPSTTGVGPLPGRTAGDYFVTTVTPRETGSDDPVPKEEDRRTPPIRVFTDRGTGPGVVSLLYPTS